MTKKKISKKLDDITRLNDELVEVTPPKFDDNFVFELGEKANDECDPNRREKYFKQYSVERGNIFRPTSKTVQALIPGLYRAREDQYGFFFERDYLDTSELIRFPNSIADLVINEFDTFWTKKDKYLDRGEPHKRGFVLWGPPGGGKTCTVSFIIKDFIKQGNIVFIFNYYLLNALNYFRTIESDRKILIIMEDIDSLIKDRHEEQGVLEFLDGSVQYTNTIVIATTNYPEELSDRIINRPSRFDRIAFVGLPSYEDRVLYLSKKAKNLSAPQLKGWAKDTENWTLAHLKELIIAVEVFELEYDETLNRINKMRLKQEHSSNYEKSLRGKKTTGF